MPYFNASDGLKLTYTIDDFTNRWLEAPGAETVGSTHNDDAMRDRIPDVEVIACEGLPHNICDSLPDRCADDVLKFLEKRFGKPS